MTTTAIAPTNIAILKYWGKAPGWERYSIPTKSSISFTVQGLETKTTVEAKRKRGAGCAIAFWLNGKPAPPGTAEHRYLEEFFSLLAESCPSVRDYDYKVSSENNFPTAAGFASSASGFAALAKALSGELEELKGVDERKLSAIARLGSGSAARSIPADGGLVIWHRGSGKRLPGSFAESLYAADFWPDLRMIYVTVESRAKKVKSREGMQRSVKTNPLYGAWVRHEEARVKKEMLGALASKDFQALGELIMKSSNGLHEICLGSYPPLVYLNQKSFGIIDRLGELNSDGVMAAYTFDAGPNAVVFTLKKNEKEVLDALSGLVGEDGLKTTKPGKGARFSEKHLF